MTEHAPKILLIDDDAMVIASMTAYLEMMGIEVLTASAVFEIPFLIGREKPDLVLLDMSLPLLDGAQILQSLSERVRRSTNFVLFSGRSRRELAILAEQLGADDCISKAEDMSAIERRIRFWIDKAQQKTA
jgi:DNA-binding response OmpR family regulator